MSLVDIKLYCGNTWVSNVKYFLPDNPKAVYLFVFWPSWCDIIENVLFLQLESDFCKYVQSFYCKSAIKQIISGFLMQRAAVGKKNMYAHTHERFMWDSASTHYVESTIYWKTLVVHLIVTICVHCCCQSYWPNLNALCCIQPLKEVSFPRNFSKSIQFEYTELVCFFLPKSQQTYLRMNLNNRLIKTE